MERRSVLKALLRNKAATKACIALLMTVVLIVYSLVFPSPSPSPLSSRRILGVVAADDTECNPRHKPNPCEYLRTAQVCIDDDNPFLEWRYCTFGANAGMAVLFYLLAALLVFVLFFLLGSTADAFFCPALLEISRYLRLPPNIAGVTLLAFGNGAPDISSTVIGIMSGKADLGLSAPVGAGVFVTTTVLGLVSLFAEVRVTRRPFIRDVLFYMLAVAFVLAAYIDGRMHLWQSLACLALYVIYVTTVVLGRFLYQRSKRRRLARLEQAAAPVDSGDETAVKMEAEGEEEWTGGWHQGSVPDLAQLLLESRSSSAPPSDVVFVPKYGIVSGSRLEVTHGLHAKHHREAKEAQAEAEEGLKAPLVIADYFATEGGEGSAGDYEKFDEYAPTKVYRTGVRGALDRMWAEMLVEMEWAERSIFSKVFYIVLAGPCNLARNLTIPRSDPEEWSRMFTALVPTFAPLFSLYVIGNAKGFTYMINGQFPLAVIFVLTGPIIGLVVFFTSRKKTPPFYFPAFVILAFFMSIMWIYLVANNLLALLAAIGVSFGIPASILGITVLAWGNSLGDTISNIVVAREGFPSMAVGACFGGPMLNLLIGVGLALTIDNIRTKRCFPLKNDPNLALSFIFVLVSLACSLVVVPICKFRSLKPYGGFLIFLYILYLGLSFAAHKLPGLNSFSHNSDLCLAK